MKRLLPPLLIIGTIVYWYMFMRFIPPPPLTVSRETTYFTDLKEKDGRFGLASSLNALYRLPPEDNAAISMLKIYGSDVLSTDSAEVAEFCELLEIAPDVLASPTLVMQLPSSASDSFVLNLSEDQQNVFRRPWQAEEFPQIAALIEANEDTFALLASMAGKKGFYWPYLERYEVWQAPMNRDFRPNQPMRLLLARGMKHLRAGELKRAWNDFACVGKAAQPMLQSDKIIYGLFGILGIKDASDAMAMLLLQQNIDEEFLAQMLTDLDAIIVTKGLERAVESETRFFLLSMYLENKELLFNQTGLNGSVSSSDFGRYIDRNVFCRKVNRLADELLQAYSIENVNERIVRLTKLQAEQEKTRASLTTSEMMTKMLWIKYFTLSENKCSEASEILSEILLGIAMPRHSGLHIEMLAVVEKLRLLKVAVLIRLHRIRTGDYPSSLEELEVADKEVLVDSFSGSNFKYLSEGNNILIYSVGPDQQDNLGASGEAFSNTEGPVASDITVRIVKF
jgi:hypothetical protein